MLVVAAGSLSYAALDAALAPHKLCFLPDPLDQATPLGALLARNMGGRRRLRYGTMASYVRGLTLRTRTRRRLELGGTTVKNVTGYALHGLLAGADGWHGQVERLALTLRALPQARAGRLLAFQAVEDACACADEALRVGMQPNCLALLDQPAQELVAPALPVGAAGALLFAEFDGHPLAVERELSRLEMIAARHAGQVVLDASDGAALASCWRPWEMLEHILHDGEETICLDLTLPREQLVAFVSRGRALAQAYGLRLVLWGDAGLGNLHPALCWQAGGAARANEARLAALLLWRAAATLGGQAAGERGNPALRAALAHSGDFQVAALRARLAAALS
jgi:glycolate oxidase